MRRALLAVAGLAVFSLACSGASPAPSAPSAPAVMGSAYPVAGFGTLTPAAPVSSGVPDFASCLATAGQSACLSALRVRSQLVGTPPGAPANLAAAVNGGTVTLTWIAPSSADPVIAYVIEAGSFPGAANLASFSTGTPATSFAANGVGAGIYYVRVRASTALAIGSTSNEVTVVVGAIGPCLPPAAPTGLVLLTNSGGTVSFVWSPASGSPTSYIVEAGSAPGLANLANSNLGLTTSLTATGVAPGVYYVRVRARNACGTSAPSNEVVLTVGPTGVCDQLVNIRLIPAPYGDLDKAQAMFDFPASLSGSANIDFTSYSGVGASWVEFDWWRASFSRTAPGQTSLSTPFIDKPFQTRWRLTLRCDGRLLAQREGPAGT